MKRATSGTMLTLLLMGMLTLAFNIQPVRASGTIYIRSDGSVEGTNKIQRDGDIYTFSDRILGEIVVQRSNIIIDGNGYMLLGPQIGTGINLNERSNVTVKNVNIIQFHYGIYLENSSNNNIVGNSITNNWYGIYLGDSSNNNIVGNGITNNLYAGIYFSKSSNNSVVGNSITRTQYAGIWLYSSSNNSIAENNITNNWLHGIYLRDSSNSNNIIRNNITENYGYGIWLYGSLTNSIMENNITKNDFGILLQYSYNDKIYHNNFIENNNQVYSYSSVNVWDDSYPSGGNYWGDYSGVDSYSGPYQNETGSDGIGDTPYIIDENNMDRYPFMNKSGWETLAPEQAIHDLIDLVESMNLQQGIDNSLDAKLTSVLASLEAVNADQRNDAINKLYAFINEVEAQRGSKITDEQADSLIVAAQRIITALVGE